MEKERPNILLIMTDQMRGDCMGFVGHPDVKTPHLDTLAAKGISFKNAYSACPSCIAARAALHTGLTPAHHGRVGYADGVSWDYPHTMAGELSKAGYYTQCVGKMHVHPLRNYLGFNNVLLHDGYLHYYRAPDVPMGENQKYADDYFYWLKNEKGIETDVTDTGIDCNSWVARPWPYEERFHPTNWVTTQSIDFLRRRDPGKPFFLMASYLRPHPPFDSPQYFFDLYKDKELAPPPMGDWIDTNAIETAAGRIIDSPTGSVDPELRRQMLIGYYACITHLDFEIGRLIMTLIENKLYDNTLIVFTSDHGDELGDHNHFRKSLPYQGSVHIPMIISGAPSLIKQKGTICDEVSELSDVMPTLLEVARPHAEAFSDSPRLDGISLFGIAKGELKHEYIHGEHSYGNASTHFIVTSNDKYIWFSQTGREQYFRLDEDGQEKRDLIGDVTYSSRIAQLRGYLINELKDREEGYCKGGELIVGIPPQALLKSLL